MKRASAGGECRARAGRRAGTGAPLPEPRGAPGLPRLRRVTARPRGHRSAARPREGGARGSRKSCRFPGKLAAAAATGLVWGLLAGRVGSCL